MTHEEFWILIERKHFRKERIIKIFNIPQDPSDRLFSDGHIPDYVNEKIKEDNE